MPKICSNKEGLGSYHAYLCQLRWSLVYGDRIVEDHLINDLRHHSFRTYFKPDEDIRAILGTLSADELIQIAILELYYLADMSDHGSVTAPDVLRTWLKLNGKWFLKSFAPLCEEKPDWKLEELQQTLEQQLALETGEE